jgi:hypothetical protein
MLIGGLIITIVPSSVNNEFSVCGTVTRFRPDTPTYGVHKDIDTLCLS